MKIASYIDHTLLSPTATQQQIDQLCREAVEHQFKSVCVSPAYAQRAVQNLNGKGPCVTSVVGFSTGATTTEVKLYETNQILEFGVQEIDMVLPHYFFQNGEFENVVNEISLLRKHVKKQPKRILKVIIETHFYGPDQIAKATELCLKAGADFVKTCTGFHGGGATIEDVKLIKSIVGDRAFIKASGGIKDALFANQLIEVGANRLGTSAGIQLIQGKTPTTGQY